MARVVSPVAEPGPGGGRRPGGPEGEGPRWARPFVAAFLVAFAVAGLLGIEAWPLTGWRLFADLRTPDQVAVRAYTVDGAGREARLPFGRLPPPYRGSTQVLNRLPSLPVADRRAVCAAWAEAVRALGRPVEAIRIYRVVWDVSRREGSRAAGPSERTLLFTCARGGP